MQTRKRTRSPDRVIVDARTDRLSKFKLKKLRERLLPGESSMVGFLHPKDDLFSLVENDSKVLARHNITHKQIADRMRQFIRHIYMSWEFEQPESRQSFVVMEKFKVSYIGTKGMQPCPFFDECRAGGSKDITVSYGDKKIMFGSLLPHLIEEHHFFEGHTPYRVDPLLAIQTLDIQPDVNYEMKEDVTIHYDWAKNRRLEDKDLPRGVHIVEKRALTKGNRTIDIVHYTRGDYRALHVTHTDVDAVETHNEFADGLKVTDNRPVIKATFNGVEAEIELPRFDMEYEEEETMGTNILQFQTYVYRKETTSCPMKEDMERLALDNGWTLAARK